MFGFLQEQIENFHNKAVYEGFKSLTIRKNYCELRDFICSRLIKLEIYRNTKEDLLKKTLGLFKEIITTSPSSLISKENCWRFMQLLDFESANKMGGENHINMMLDVLKDFFYSTKKIQKIDVVNRKIIIDSLKEEKKFKYTLKVVIHFLLTKYPTFIDEPPSLSKKEEELLKEAFESDKIIKEIIVKTVLKVKKIKTPLSFQEPIFKELIILLFYFKNRDDYSEKILAVHILNENDLKLFLKIYILVSEFFLSLNTELFDKSKDGLIYFTNLFDEALMTRKEKFNDGEFYPITLNFFNEILKREKNLEKPSANRLNVMKIVLDGFQKSLENIVVASYEYLQNSKRKIYKTFEKIECFEERFLLQDLMGFDNVLSIIKIFDKIIDKFKGDQQIIFQAIKDCLNATLHDFNAKTTTNQRSSKCLSLINLVNCIDYFSSLEVMKWLFEGKDLNNQFSKNLQNLLLLVKSTKLFSTKIKIQRNDCYKIPSELCLDLFFRAFALNSLSEGSIFLTDEMFAFDENKENNEEEIRDILVSYQTEESIIYPLFFYLKFLMFYKLSESYLSPPYKQGFQNHISSLSKVIESKSNEISKYEIQEDPTKINFYNEYIKALKEVLEKNKCFDTEKCDTIFFERVFKILETSKNDIEKLGEYYCKFHSSSCLKGIYLQTSEDNDWNFFKRERKINALYSKITGLKKYIKSNPVLGILKKSVTPQEKNIFLEAEKIEGEEISLESVELNEKTNLFFPKSQLFNSRLSVEFKDIFFYDPNFPKIRGKFCSRFHGYYHTKQLNFFSKIRNFSDGLDAPFFLKRYFKFYQNPYLKITHAYLDDIMDKLKKNSFNVFNKIELCGTPKSEYICELIKNEYVIEGTIKTFDRYIYFSDLDDPDSNFEKICKNKEDSKIFGSVPSDIIKKKKKLLIYYSEIDKVVFKRFLYMWQAVEIFLKNGKSFFFNLFHTNSLNDFATYLEKKKSFRILNKDDQIKEVKKAESLWSNYQISTYEYLLRLNQFSSRTFNDLNQYYIFPWVINDLTYFFENQEEKGEKEVPLRNFLYFMGIQTPTNQERTKEAFDAHLARKEFTHYLSSHYSTSAFVLYYLLRLSPFTQMLVKFQNNSQENPNRMFSSLEHTQSIINNFSDNRELVPQFFSQIEFMINFNCTEFGQLVTKKIVDDITIKKKTKVKFLEHFIIKHRVFLDSKEIHESISRWIDNVFGIYQLDFKKAKENIFPSSTYEQKMNLLEKYENYKKRQSKEVEGKKKITAEERFKKIRRKCELIINFGQTPRQVFKDKSEYTHKKHFSFVKKIQKIQKLQKVTLEKKEEKEEKENFIYYKIFDAKIDGTDLKMIYFFTDNKKFYFYNFKDIMTKRSCKIFGSIYSNHFESLIVSGKVTELPSNFESIFSEMSAGGCVHILSCNYKENVIRVNYWQRYLEKTNHPCENKSYSIMVDSLARCICKTSETNFIVGLESGKIIEFEYQDKEEFYDEKRSVVAHLGEVKIMNYVKKLKIIVSYGEDNYIYVRKYDNFELLSVFELKPIYYCTILKMDDRLNFIYLICSFKEESKTNKYKSLILGYTLNGINFYGKLQANAILNLDFSPDENFFILDNEGDNKWGIIIIKNSFSGESEFEPTGKKDIKYFRFFFDDNQEYLSYCNKSFFFYEEYDDKSI